MANHKSALKHHRQSLKRRDRNRGHRARMRTAIKKFRAMIAAGDASDREVVALRSAAGEEDLFRVSANGRRNARAGLFHGSSGDLSESMRTSGVAKRIRQKWLHRLRYARCNRRRGVMVHVNWQVDRHRFKLTRPGSVYS